MDNVPNLNSYYTTNPKVEKPTHVVVSAPVNIPKKPVFDTKEADKKMRKISQDIYEGTQIEKKKDSKTFWTIFAGTILTILGIKLICKLFR